MRHVLACLAFSCFAPAQHLVADLAPGLSDVVLQARDSAALGGHAYFMGHDTVGSECLWSSDGSVAGTQVVRSFGSFGASVGGSVFATATQLLIARGNELWRSDGTLAGTSLITLLPAAVGFVAELPSCVLLSNGGSLARTDGTAAGTFALPAGMQTPTQRVEGSLQAHVGARFFFVSPSDGELWSTDGTVAGTGLVTDLQPGGRSQPMQLAEANGLLWFNAEPFVLAARDLGAAGVDDLGGGCSLRGGQAPRLVSEGAPPLLGGPVALALRSAPAQTPMLWVLSLTPGVLDLWGSCTLRLGEPFFTWQAATAGDGGASALLPLPATSALLGVPVHVQDLVLDAPSWLVVSNALRLVPGL